MASSFLRLYRYAKAVGAEAKENNTTEALRAAIERSSRLIQTPSKKRAQLCGVARYRANSDLSRLDSWRVE